jgi:Ca2+-binding EF-hand superfamily protein
MGNALKTFGYNLSDQFIRVLVQKFDKYGMQKKKKVYMLNLHL